MKRYHRVTVTLILRSAPSTLAPRHLGTAYECPRRWRDIALRRSADRSTKDAHIIATRNLPGVFWREAAAQHRRDELHPLRVVLQTAGSDLLVGADGNMLYPDDLNHFFQAVDIIFESREEVPDPDCTARL